MTTLKKLLLTVAVVGVTGVAAGFSTFSAFTATTTNPGNSIATGTVTVNDNDASAPMYAVSGAQADDVVERCIKVTYTGSLAADVRLSTPSALPASADYIDLTIEKGTGGGAFPSCAGFSPEAEIYDSTLGDFAATHTDWASGVAANPGAQTEWDQNDAVVYRFTLTVQNDPAAMGNAIGAHDFVWEARNQ